MTLTTAAGIMVPVLLALADRGIKSYFTTFPARGGEIFVGWLEIAAVPNPGLAFGLPFPPGWLPPLSLVIIAVLVWWWGKAFRRGQQTAQFSLALLTLGACSNLVDRVRWGYVLDYISVPVFTVFNVADAMITVGVGLLIMQELIRWFQRRWKERANS